jgi:hypothetical protein
MLWTFPVSTNVCCTMLHVVTSLGSIVSQPLVSNIGQWICSIKDSVLDIGWFIDYLRFYVLLKNISLIWRRHHCRWRAAKFRPMFGAQGSLSCHTCCDTGSRIFRSHPKDRPVQSPLTTHEGMWKIYSNSDPHWGAWYRNIQFLSKELFGFLLLLLL